MSRRPRVIVAMSGGVDSSVAAALLLNRGFAVSGLTLRLAEEGESRPVFSPNGQRLAAVDDARRVADVLAIEHRVLDWRSKFRDAVIEPFIASYAAGQTPNPCVFCNERIKFAALLEAAEKYGAEYIATGHYAKISAAADGPRLCRAKDAKKDQSYVLYRLPPAVLSRLILPLGAYEKAEIRALAEKYRLPVAQKAESQEICFIPDDDYRAFLRAHSPAALKPGNIVDKQGRILGRHNGVSFYTVGQRRGLGIASGEPLYVRRLDAAKQEISVGADRELWTDSLAAADLAWTSGRLPSAPFKATAKIRYNHAGSPATVCLSDTGKTAAVKFAAPVRAVTPGQSVVFYDGDTVIGGGVIQAERQP